MQRRTPLNCQRAPGGKKLRYVLRMWVIEVAHRSLTRNIALPAWVHTRSRYQFFDAILPPGIAVEVRSRVVDARVRKGRDEVRLDVQIVHEGRVVVALDHEAIIRFR